MEARNLKEILKDKGIDINNISAEDIVSIIKMQVKGEFGKEIFKQLMQNSNITYKQYLDSLGKFIDNDKESSKAYQETISWLIKDLRKEAERAETEEAKEKIHAKIESLLDRMEKEVNRKREQGIKYAALAVGALTIVGGLGFYAITKNPALLKKGAEIVAQAAAQQVIK
jgi:hypothetical protein